MLLQQETEQSRQHVASQVARLEQLHTDERLYQDVTRSLFYPEIFSRQEQVANEFDGIENSYEWVFDEPLDAEGELQDQSVRIPKKQRWDSFFGMA